jgi:hypothetical protein
MIAVLLPLAKKNASGTKLNNAPSITQILRLPIENEVTSWDAGGAKFNCTVQ